jgi:hypothetical protein
VRVATVPGATVARTGTVTRTATVAPVGTPTAADASEVGEHLRADPLVTERSGVGVVDREHVIRRDSRDGGRIERRALPPSSNEPVPIGAVAAIRYDPDGPPIAPISRADATIAVLEKCVCAASRPADAFDATVSIFVASRAVAGCHADAAQALAILGGIRLRHRVTVTERLGPCCDKHWRCETVSGETPNEDRLSAGASNSHSLRRVRTHRPSNGADRLMRLLIHNRGECGRLGPCRRSV